MVPRAGSGAPLWASEAQPLKYVSEESAIEKDKMYVLLKLYYVKSVIGLELLHFLC